MHRTSFLNLVWVLILGASGCSTSKALKSRIHMVESRVNKLEQLAQSTEVKAQEARQIAYQNQVEMQEAKRLAKIARDVAHGNLVRTEVRKVVVYFDHGGSVLRHESRAILAGVVEELKQNPSYRACIAGFTDDSGDAAYNLFLSERRADQVFRFLASRLGSETVRLVRVGLGETLPIAKNDSDNGRSQNRRVEVTVVAESFEPAEKKVTRRP